MFSYIKLGVLNMVRYYSDSYCDCNIIHSYNFCIIVLILTDTNIKITMM